MGLICIGTMYMLAFFYMDIYSMAEGEFVCHTSLWSDVSAYCKILREVMILPPID